MGRVYNRNGRKGWYVDYVDVDGRRVRRLASTDKRTAERVLREAERERDLIKCGFAPAVSNDCDVGEVWTVFRSHLEATGRRPRTIEHYEGLVPQFIRIVGAEKVKDVTPQKAGLYLQNRTAAGLSPRRVNAGLRAVQTMLRWASRQGMIGQNPLRHCDKVQERKVKPRRPLEDWEIKKLLEASPPRYRRIWTAFLTTGLRKNELIELRWKDVDLERGLLRVRAEICKVRREDFIPIAPELEVVLLAIRPDRPEPEAHVFLNAAGRPWRNNLLTRFKYCVKTAGIDPVGLDIHSLRQTYGTLLASDPANDVRTVMSLMRHSTVAMTMNVYAKPRAMRQREAMKSINLANRGTGEALAETDAPQQLKPA